MREEVEVEWGMKDVVESWTGEVWLCVGVRGGENDSGSG